MTVQATFDVDAIDIESGAASTVMLTITNLGADSDSFTLVPAGLAATWCTIVPSTVTLLGGAEDQVRVRVTAPRLPSTTAGPAALNVRVISFADPDDAVEASIVLNVGDVRERRLTLLQPALRSRTAATFELMLENRGNVQASCRLRLVEPSGRLQAEFDPPAAGVDAGATTLVRARVRTTRRQWERRSRNIPIRFEAEEAGVPTSAAVGTFVQAPMIPTGLLWRLISLLALASLVVAGWFAVARPTIRDAADDAVARRVPVPSVATTVGPTTATIATNPDGSPTRSGSVPPSSEPSTTAPTTTVAASTTVAGAAAGTPLATRLAVSVAPGQTDQVTYEVPAGIVLRLTDVVLQNPNFDRGQATLSRGEDVLLTWGIDNLPVFVSTPFVTPIELRPGDRLVFTVSCTGVGDGSTGTCTPALLISGRQVPQG